MSERGPLVSDIIQHLTNYQVTTDTESLKAF